MSSVQIRLIRNNNSIEDDITTIRYRHNRPDFLVRYTDGTFPGTVWVQDKSFFDVMDHLERMLHFLLMDCDTFRHIQVNIPGSPMVLILVHGLTQDTIDMIIEAVSRALSSPPSSFTVSAHQVNNGVRGNIM
jgi:hypothetical protein